MPVTEITGARVSGLGLWASGLGRGSGLLPWFIGIVVLLLLLGIGLVRFEASTGQFANWEEREQAPALQKRGCHVPTAPF